MRARLFAAFAFATAMIALPAFAEGPVNPARSSIPMYDFPLKNGQARDEIYKMSEHKNGVFVFEALRLSADIATRTRQPLIGLRPSMQATHACRSSTSALTLLTMTSLNGLTAITPITL
jgi:hypothetical protein